MLRKIFQKILIHKRNYAVPNPQNLNFPLELIGETIKIKPNRLEIALRENQNLYQTHPQQWSNFFGTLTTQGFQRESCLKMITHYPKLLTKPQTELLSTLENWRNTQFGESQIIEILSSNPELLDIPAKEINPRILDLLTIFPSRGKIKKLLDLNPGVMYLRWKTVVEMQDYLQNVMRIEIPEIYKSPVFRLTLDELKMRHVFLCRLGMFKPRNPKASPLDPCLNPKLWEITVGNDADFAKNVAGVTEEEWEVFKELFSREKGDDDLEDDENKYS